MDPLDRERLRQALGLAERAIGLSDPNPRVGCVIGHADGRIVGQGSTQRAGEAHAEVMALRDALAAGAEVRGATAWVSLEPCSHHGRTPPCCDALAAAGIVRVVCAVADPNPLVAGRGIERLRAAGVRVDLGDEEPAAAARDINVGFFSRMERGRPWVRLKAAASLDGITALANGQSRWITGEAARADGHLWRRRASVIVSGIGTVLADDPRLDVRTPEPPARPPLRLILDSAARTPPTAAVLRTPGAVAVACTEGADGSRREALVAAGAEIVTLPSANGRPDPAALVAWLAAREANEVHVEAGPTLNAALLTAGIVDELVVYLAPLLLGPGRPIAALAPMTTLAEGLALGVTEVRMVGPDLRVRAHTRRR